MSGDGVGLTEAERAAWIAARVAEIQRAIDAAWAEDAGEVGTDG